MASTKPQQLENPSTQDSAKEDSVPSNSAPLALPPPSDVSASTSTSQTVKLDALGPMVINSDGTLSRIHNWAEMTEAERERTLRILGKRNQLRRENILATEGESENGTVADGERS
ncbi:hypothetical protein G647_02591 [Cladophialophora carrionii CBS 160.54]|uniref:Uncharacterized protein n=1 Tax=Cladophialophora carrionii CBS 160.54 TaxID=1279043 RepID=V9DG18_9EURO|nr:uncharacterized protein G647_02591 [Cladophialophora carrionii CBS 160.54]ETI25815.1 hypothetical protein G647_02591 [Cladophialophora carrionii CBS 160.54]